MILFFGGGGRGDSERDDGIEELINTWSAHKIVVQLQIENHNGLCI